MLRAWPSKAILGDIDMLRGMVFVDHMNFDIAVTEYYNGIGKKKPSLDYNTIFKGIVSCIPDVIANVKSDYACNFNQ